MTSPRIACVLAILSVGSAYAKELPRWKADEEPKKGSTGCDYLGQGYVKEAGSDTCIKISGSVRVEGSTTR